MNATTLKGQLKQLTGKAKKEWAKLTNDDWLSIEGDFDRLSGLIQERYGVAKEAAEGQIREFMARIEQAAKPRRASRARTATGRLDRRTATDREHAAAGL